MDSLIKDVWLGVRRLRRDPLLTATAIVSLAIGIGANTALYTVARGLLFQAPAGVVRPGDLVDIGRTSDGYGFNTLSYPAYAAVRDRTTRLSSVYATNLFPQAVSVTTSGGHRDRLFASLVSSNYFIALGVGPARGRLLQPADGEGAGAAPVVVISDALWSRLFNRSADAIGQSLILNGQPATIVGIAPARFHGAGVRSAEAWVPIGSLQSADAARLLTTTDGSWLLVGGRRRPDVTIDQVNAQLTAIAASLPPPGTAQSTFGLRAVSASPIPGGAGSVGLFLTLLLAVVAAVLAVACANVAGMLLSRVPLRLQEMAVRGAIGASRARLARQLLIETLLLFLAGAAAGLLVAAALIRAVLSILPAFPFPIELSLPIDMRVALLATALAFIAAIASGLVPTLQGSRVALSTTLNAQRHGAGGLRLRRTFVVAQVSLSIVLVVVGGLFVRAMLHAGAASPGFDARGVELVSVSFTASPTAAPDATTLTLNAILERVNSVPGIDRASAASSFPGGFEEMRLGALRVPSSGRHVDDGEWNIVTPGFFDTIRMPLRAGRDFTTADRPGATRVAIIGEGAARRLWPGRPVVLDVGEVVEQLGFNPATQKPETTPVTIVGVSADPAYGTLIDGRNDIHIYVPMGQVRSPRTMLVVRTRDGRSAASEVRAAIAAVAPSATVDSTRAAEEYSMLGLLPQRVGASVTATLGLVGLLLAAIGVYGVTASAVANRRREIGIRMALGAPVAAIARMVVGEGLSLVGIGALAGLPLAFGAGHLVAGHLAGLPPTDPVTFWGALGAFAVMGLLACSAPLVRALRISPTETLRDA